MPPFTTVPLPATPTAIAPDGTAVRPLPVLPGGSLTHFTLAPWQTSLAVTHRTVEEIWYFLSGRGEMWRKQDDHEEIVAALPGVSLTIPLGTHFQFRNLGDEPLAFVAITMPPWPGGDEAYTVAGIWEPTVDGDPAP